MYKQGPGGSLEQKQYLVGIFSFGTSQCGQGYPGVYKYIS